MTSEELQRLIEEKISAMARTHAATKEHSYGDLYTACLISYKGGANTIAKLMVPLIEALEMANDRHLDWDMMDREHSLRLLQKWRGKCFEALENFRKELG